MGYDMEKMADFFSIRLNKKLNLSELEYQKLRYGMEVIFINVLKTVIVFVLAAFFGIWKDTIIIFIAFAAFRLYAFGLHAKNSIVCTLISCTTHVIIPIITRELWLDKRIAVIIFAIFTICFICYAPADTESHPLIGEEFRKKLKIRAVIVSIVLPVMGVFFFTNRIMMLILCAEFYAVVGIAPVTYTILQRRKRNYEQYENE